MQELVHELRSIQPHSILALRFRGRGGGHHHRDSHSRLDDLRRIRRRPRGSLGRTTPGPNRGQAAVMAAAIEYIRSNPTEDEIVTLVKDYVERNIGYPAASAGWGACPVPTDGFEALAGNNCISLKQASTTSSDTLLQVRIPVQPVETPFRRHHRDRHDRCIRVRYRPDPEERGTPGRYAVRVAG